MAKRETHAVGDAEKPEKPAWIVAGIEWTRLRNSSQGMYQMVSPLLLVVLFALRSARGAHGDWMLAAATGYLSLGLRASNVFGSEGSGVQNYLRFPQPIRLVLIGKNLFAALLFAVQFVIAALLVRLVHGSMGAAPIAFSLLWALGYMGLAMRIGNTRSLTAPILLQDTGRIHPGAMQRRQPARGAWWTILLIFGAGSLGAAVLFLCFWIGRLWLAPWLILPFTATGIFVYLKGLQNEDLDGRPGAMEAVLLMSAAAD